MRPHSRPRYGFREVNGSKTLESGAVSNCVGWTCLAPVQFGAQVTMVFSMSVCRCHDHLILSRGCSIRASKNPSSWVIGVPDLADQ